MHWRHLVLMVETDADEVDRALRVGGLACPVCGAGLARWGHARTRTLRGVGGALVRLRPRRAWCAGCGRTHVLLPTSCLVRRADQVEVIGAALVAKAAGSGHRRIAATLGAAVSTVRGWLRGFAAGAAVVRAGAAALLVELDPVTGPLAAAGSVFADAVGALGALASAARRRLGADVGGWSPWQVASAISGGWLLHSVRLTESINTSWPWAPRR